MLSRDKNIVHSERHESTCLVAVLNNDLSLAVRAQPRNGTILSLDGHLLAELVSQVVRVRVECLGVPLVGSVAEHKTLVSSTKLTLRFISVNRRGNIGILRLDVCDHLAVGAVEPNLLTSVANLAADVTSDLLKVHLLRGDVSLAKQYDLKNKVFS